MDPHSEPGTTVIAVGNFGYLRNMQRTLERGGVPAEIVQPPGTNANA